jgi:lipopolysaccharide export system permease protein
VAAGARQSAWPAARRGGAGMSSILSRYVIRAVLGTTLLVMLVLLVLSGLYLFITQQDEIGIGTYTLTDALMFVGLNLPKYAFDMLPIAALIGALLALGNLARSMELIVVRAAGVSVARIAMWVVGAGVILMLLTGVLGELIAPQMEQYGRRMKTFEKYHDYSLAGNRSAWAKDGETVVSVGQQSGDNRYGGVYVFNFDQQHRLRSVGRASSASIDTSNVWRLENYRESRFEEDRVVPSGPSTTQMRSRLSPEFLGLAVLDPQSLPGMGLLSYIRHLKENGLDARAYETAFWARIARTVAVAIIVVLAVPFAFGPMRSTGTGARTVVGIMIGVVFFLMAKMLESGGAVFQLPPVVIAWLPTALLALITAVAVKRVR